MSTEYPARIFTLGALLAQPNDMAWRVPGLLPSEGIAVIGAPPKSAKTILGLNWAYALAGGLSCFGRPMAVGRVLYVDRELGRHVIQKRLASIHAAAGSERSMEDLLVCCRQRWPVSLSPHSPGFENLCAIVSGEGPGVVMLDPLRNFHTGDENDSSAAQRVSDSIFHLADTYHCAVVVLHHTAKPRENGLSAHADPMMLRGSSHFFAMGDSYIMLESLSPFSCRASFRMRHDVWEPRVMNWAKDRYYLNWPEPQRRSI